MNEPILVVDDHPLNLKLTSIVLTQAGYSVCGAANAEEAVVALKSFEPRLILMDIQLPGIDGLTLTRQIKSNPKWKRIPVIALTAYAMKSDEERVKQAGCDGCISKPINTRTLPNQIAAYLTSP